MTAPTWNDQFELPDDLNSVSDIQYYISDIQDIQYYIQY